MKNHGKHILPERSICFVWVGFLLFQMQCRYQCCKSECERSLGGHSVPEEKIRSRYDKALALIPKFIEICDILHIYDNTQEPFRIFKKRKDVYYRWSNQYWSDDDIKKLSGIAEFVN